MRCNLLLNFFLITIDPLAVNRKAPPAAIASALLPASPLPATRLDSPEVLRASPASPEHNVSDSSAQVSVLIALLSNPCRNLSNGAGSGSKDLQLLSRQHVSMVPAGSVKARGRLNYTLCMAEACDRDFRIVADDAAEFTEFALLHSRETSCDRSLIT